MPQIDPRLFIAKNAIKRKYIKIFMLNDNLKETYNKIAKDWSNNTGGGDSWMEGIDVFLLFLSKGAKILDLGCGSGYKTKYIHDKGFEVEGVDFSEEMIKNAERKYPEINFDILDVYDLDKYSKRFDGIFSQAVLMHIPKKEIFDILEKIVSKLNKGGVIYISMPEIKVVGIEEEMRTDNDYGYDYERFFSYYTLDEVKKLFREIGLEIIYEKIISSGKSNWINIIGKK